MAHVVVTFTSCHARQGKKIERVHARIFHDGTDIYAQLPSGRGKIGIILVRSFHENHGRSIEIT